ncbi:LacI family DNA-binding transcriptional regulator [Paeniglutamicibacter sp. MACA_103]|uniref:LacI family DNA-binding transcriptional regulator n=1 Tax=Paeniglutamicibacter sp. MACA_103 TaxID=3377337 RepID=UPI0038936815
MAVTVRDIARIAGVSISTVSRALSSPEMVNAATRAKVQETARKLGYTPNLNARNLISGRSGAIGLVVPDLENPFFGSMAKGVQARARAAGYAVFIADTDEDASVENEIIRGLSRQVDGVIVCSARGTDASIQELSRDMPLVLVNRRVQEVSSITFDHAESFRSVMGHLMALGHRKIAYAGGPQTSWSNLQRVQAFAAAGKKFPELKLAELGNFQPVFTGGIAAGDLAIASGATAVVAFNDLVAVGLMDRLRQRGLNVPGDISVTGFDNVPVSTLVWPTLTTVDFPRVQMGRTSVDALLEALRGTPRKTDCHEIPFELVVRESTGVAKPGSMEASPSSTTASAIGG